MWLKGKFYIPKQTRSIFGWVGVHKSCAIRQLLVDFSFHYQQSLMMSLHPNHHETLVTCMMQILFQLFVKLTFYKVCFKHDIQLLL